MADMGVATIFPSDRVLSTADCANCNNNHSCLSGKGITVIVRGIRHLSLPDYQNSWNLIVDLPECKQPNKLFSMARISALLYTGNRTKVEGKIFEVIITNFTELSVVEI
jgi:hypothetical protein